MADSKILESESQDERNSETIHGIEIEGERIYGGVIDVREFGAFPAGGLNAGQRAAAIQRAIDAAASREAKPRVRIPCAQADSELDAWVLGRQGADASAATPVYALDLKSGVDLVGDGQDATVLRLDGEDFGAEPMTILRALDVSRIRVSDMTLDGNAATAQGAGDPTNILVAATAETGDGSSRIVFERVNCINALGIGLSIGGGDAEILASDILVRDCRFADNVGGGVSVGRYSSLVRINDSLFEVSGISIDDAPLCDVLRCELIGDVGTPAGVGITVASTNDETVDARLVNNRLRGWVKGCLVGAADTVASGVDIDNVYDACTTAVEVAGTLSNLRLRQQRFGTVTTEYSGTSGLPVGDQFVLVKEHAENANAGTQTNRVAKAHRRMVIESVRYVNPTGLAADNDNFATFSLKNGATTIATFHTEADAMPAGVTLTANAYQDATLSSTPADLIVAVDDVLDWVVAESGTTTVPAGRVEVYGRFLS